MKKQLLLFVLLLLPVVASADKSGKCGNNVYYTYNETTHTLTISGEGDMYDYYGEGDYTPWNFYLDVIQSVVIESGVTSIGVGALSRVEDHYCKNLTSVTVPNSVTSIGTEAFYCCSSLTSVNISDLAAWCNIKFSGDESNPLYYAHHLYINGNEITNLDIPNDVTSIGDYAFTSCSGLASVTIPNSVTSIGNFAFRNCSGLTSVTIGNSVTSIGNFAFQNCSGLTSIQVESGNQYYDSRNNCNAIIDSNNQLILGCKNTIIPNSVTSIGSSAFNGCTGLTSITIPNSVTSIGVNAFGGCNGLTSVTIGNNVTSIGEYAFQNCRGLTSVTIPNSVTSVGVCVFSGCSGLTSVTIPNSVTSIGECAFYGCSGLTSVTIPNSVTSIGNYAFYGCSGLTSITIPNSVTSIRGDAFSSCSGLTSIQVESGNQNYDSRNNCNAIIDSNNRLILGCKNTTIPNSVTSIGGSAFWGCSGLTSITIPNSVTSIGSDAFYNCSGLVYITLPSKLASIGEDAFFGCNSLIDIFCKAEKNFPSGADIFGGINTGNIILHVPFGSMEAYKSTEPWNKFGSYYSLDNSVTQGGQKCSKPTISVVDGKIVFSCETQDVSYRWCISTPNGSNGTANSYNSNIAQPVTLNVFAMKDGYLPSDVATYALSGTPVPASVVGNPVITFSLNIINRSGKAVTLDGDVEFLLGNPDHNGTYLGWDGSYNYTDPIRFSGSPVTLAAGETKTFDGLTWCDEETGSGMGEKSPLDPSQWEASSSNRNVKLYVGGSDEVVVCNNMDPSIIFKEGGIYSIVISSGENTTPVNPTPLVGDVNGDGKVNVADHVKLSEIIMEQDK